MIWLFKVLFAEIEIHLIDNFFDAHPIKKRFISAISGLKIKSVASEQWNYASNFPSKKMEFDESLDCFHRGRTNKLTTIAVLQVHVFLSCLSLHRSLSSQSFSHA